MQKCSLYHYITTNGKYKSAVIIQLNKEIGSDLSKVLLIFQVSKCYFLCNLWANIVNLFFKFLGEREENSTLRNEKNALWKVSIILRN